MEEHAVSTVRQKLVKPSANAIRPDAIEMAPPVAANALSGPALALDEAVGGAPPELVLSAAALLPAMPTAAPMSSPASVPRSLLEQQSAA